MPQQAQQNFDAMRQDAIRRSREMQRRAAPMQNRPTAPASEPPPAASQEDPVRHPAPPYQQPVSSRPQQPHGFLQQLDLPKELNDLLKDWNGEKLALAGLLYLLYKEGADISLLLALAYILL